jgi:hypothetical protein
MRHSSKFVRILALILCCVLLVFLTVEAAHMHAPGTDAAHCRLCIAAHVGLSTEIVAAAALILAAVAMLIERRAAAGFWVSRSTHRIRPPPACGLLPATLHLL